MISLPQEPIGNKRRWKGGFKIDKEGYIQMHNPSHPNAKGQYVPFHRVVMECSSV